MQWSYILDGVLLGEATMSRRLVMSHDANDFLKMIRSWESVQDVMKEEDERFVKAKMLVDGHDFIFFFACRGNIYGANENARSVFSVMKNPMDEMGYEDMSFSATNLSSAMKGEPKEEIFIYKDIDHIKVINKEVARHLLMSRHKPHSEKKHSEVQAKMRDIDAHRRARDQRTKDGRHKLNKDFEELK
jgi:hypothetical protein